LAPSLRRCFSSFRYKYIIILGWLEKQNIIQTIKNDSVVAWQHINLQGEYDFSEETLRDSIEFRLPELLALKVS